MAGVRWGRRRDCVALRHDSAAVNPLPQPLPSTSGAAAAAGHAPLLDVVRGARHERKLLRVSRHASDRLLVVGEDGHRFAGDDVPQLHARTR